MSTYQSHILGFEIVAYSHPRSQACLFSCVLFLAAGTYNVITFLGGAGQQTAYLSDVANIGRHFGRNHFLFLNVS